MNSITVAMSITVKNWNLFEMTEAAVCYTEVLVSMLLNRRDSIQLHVFYLPWNGWNDLVCSLHVVILVFVQFVLL